MARHTVSTFINLLSHHNSTNYTHALNCFILRHLVGLPQIRPILSLVLKFDCIRTILRYYLWSSDIIPLPAFRLFILLYYR